MSILNKLSILFAFYCSVNLVNAQFTIVNELKTSDREGLEIGDYAYLTAERGVDQNGAGYLRLTDALKNQKGYLYVKQAFPTTLGVVADFEYKAWRDVDDSTYHGADGFTIFLFDGNTTEEQFKLGGYGGSLGYAPLLSQKGLVGGYLGIGFDAYGNYITPNESRIGGIDTISPNSVVLRGPTNSDDSKTNVYLAHKQLGNSDARENEIDYNTTTNTRPSDEVYYRRVQVSIDKVGIDYLVTVKWRKENETIFKEILRYTMKSSDYSLPSNLKLGFAAGTGGGVNYHELRNILLTTPGNLRVDSRTNTSFVCGDKNNTVTYKVEVTNDTATANDSISVRSKITNDLGELLNQNQFKIKTISTTGFTNSTIANSVETNEFSGIVGLPANSSGIITITGEYLKKSLRFNRKLRSITTVESSFTDLDTTNNTASSDVILKKCLVISNPSLPSY